MNLKTAKTPKDVTLAGITVEFEKHDGVVSAVILRDANGGLLKVAVASYHLDVLVPSPPKLVGRWRVRGALGEVAVDETFTHEFEANGRVSELGLGVEVRPEKILLEE